MCGRDEAIAVDALGLVHEERCELVGRGEERRIAHQKALEDAREVPDRKLEARGCGSAARLRRSLSRETGRKTKAEREREQKRRREGLEDLVVEVGGRLAEGFGNLDAERPWESEARPGESARKD